MEAGRKSIEIGVVGLGQCGGNLGYEFYQRGYKVVCLNTSQNDLRALPIPEEEKLYIGLFGRDGTGQDVVLGRRYLEDNSSKITELIGDRLSNSDHLLLTAGLGGGTGSNITTLITILKELRKPISLFLTLPRDIEGSIAKVNAVKAIDEVRESGSISYILLDNQKIFEFLPKVNLASFYEETNRTVVDIFDEINSISQNHLFFPLRSFDSEDLRKVFSFPGVLTYGLSRINSNDLKSDDSLSSVLRQQWDSGGLLASGFDYTSATICALILLVPKKVLEENPASIYENLIGAATELTRGNAIYTGLFQIPDEEPIRLYTLLGGLPLPNRIDTLLSLAKEEGVRLGEKLTRKAPGLNLGEIKELNFFTRGESSSIDEGTLRDRSTADREEEIKKKAFLEQAELSGIEIEDLKKMEVVESSKGDTILQTTDEVRVDEIPLGAVAEGETQEILPAVEEKVTITDEVREDEIPLGAVAEGETQEIPPAVEEKVTIEDSVTPFKIFGSTQRRLLGFPMRTRIGLDIGSHSIKAVQIKGSKILTLLLSEASKTNNLEEFFKRARRVKAKIFTAVGGDSIVVKQIEIPLSTKKTLDHNLKQEAQKHIPYPLEDVAMDWQSMGTISGSKSSDVLIVAVKKELREQHLALLRSLDIEPQAVELEPLALMNSFFNSFALQEGETVVMLDIGAEKTTLNIFREGGLYFTHYLPMGGNRLTQVIEEEMGLDYSEAEELKKKGDISIFRLLEPNLSLFIQDLKNSLVYYENRSENKGLDRRIVLNAASIGPLRGNKGFDRIVLSGGSSNLNNLPEYLTEQLGIMTEVFNPLMDLDRNGDITQETIEDLGPQFALAFGLATKGR